jgi:hypothetical protein
MEYFYLEEERVGQNSFRFLTWSRFDTDEEEFSIVPDDVDLVSVVGHFISKKVEQVVIPDREIDS